MFYIQIQCLFVCVECECVYARVKIVENKGSDKKGVVWWCGVRLEVRQSNYKLAGVENSSNLWNNEQKNNINK